MVRRQRILATALFISLLLPLASVQGVSGTHYGDGNLPAGCSDAVEAESAPPHFVDECYHMRTGLNDLDTPIIDVLLVPPASPWAERDLRQMRQAVESWRDGIRHLAPQMGLDWLADGVEFNIFVDNDAITTDPAWDPEIVIVAANPVLAGVQGIGIDPTGLSAPCRGANPLASFDAWNALPGFENHHGQSGTYVEECPGGGTTCYAVNLAIDPVPGATMGAAGMHTFWLVQHEFGHCLSVGHVGDAGDHTSADPPVSDIMAYTVTPHFKCVSSLDVEAFAVRMSRFLQPTPLVPNDATGVEGSYQVQHPSDHFYATVTGLPEDCPAPNDGLVPFVDDPVSWTPSGGRTRTPASIAITSHADGDHVAAGLVTIAGTVSYGADPAVDADEDSVADNEDNCPGDANTDQRDRDGDGFGDACDATDGGLPIPDGSIRGNVVFFTNGLGANNLAHTAHNEFGDRATKFAPGQPVTLTSRTTTADEGLVTVNVSKFTWTIWDEDANVVLTSPCTTAIDGAGFRCDSAITLPNAPGRYYVSALLQGGDRWIHHHDDGTLQARAPPVRYEGLKAIEILGVPAPGVPSIPEHASIVNFEDRGTPKNTFFPEESSLSTRSIVRLAPIDKSEFFTLRLDQPSNVRLTLSWSSSTGRDDLDLTTEGAAFAAGDENLLSTGLQDFEIPGTTSETIEFEGLQGTLRIRVEPVLITATDGTTYTLVAEIGIPPPDADGDGVLDESDLCPDTPAGEPVDADGCPLPVDETERVEIRVDGIFAASEIVDGRGGDTFSRPIDLAGKSGNVVVTATWYDGAYAVHSRTITLVVE